MIKECIFCDLCEDQIIIETHTDFVGMCFHMGGIHSAGYEDADKHICKKCSVFIAQEIGSKLDLL